MVSVNKICLIIIIIVVVMYVVTVDASDDRLTPTMATFVGKLFEEVGGSRF